MRVSCRMALASMMGAVAVASSAHAEPASSIELEAPPGCAVTEAQFEERVMDALVGRRAADLVARVAIEETNGAYRAQLSIDRGSTAVGTSVITAPTCEEAVDAAALALALALGERAVSSASVAVPERAQVPAPKRSAVRWLRVSSSAPDADVSPPAARRVSEHHWRALLMTGLDAGTLAAATPYAGVGVAWVSGHVELGGGVRYGLPRVEEETNVAGTARTRREFAGLDAGACYGAGERARFAACAGGELGVVRHVERRRAPDVETDEEQAAPRLSGVVRAVFAHRAGLVQPELELSGLAVALGRQDDARWLAVRVAAGAAVQF